MTHTKITADNIFNFSLGTKVVMNWGAYHPIEEGMVVDYKVTPASKHFPAMYELVIEDSEGEEHTTSMLVTKGIGVYLEEEYYKV